MFWANAIILHLEEYASRMEQFKAIWLEVKLDSLLGRKGSHIIQSNKNK